MQRLLHDSTTCLHPARRGQALALLAIVIPALVAIVALVVDAGMMFSEYRDLQSVVDAAATAAARDLGLGNSIATTRATANAYVQENGQTTAEVTVNVPPTSGPYAGNSSYVEVIVTEDVPAFFSRVAGNASSNPVTTRAVAGVEPATTGAAIVVLDPTPSPITVSATAVVSLSLTVPPLNIAGLETLGLGQVKVDGAVLVNTEWGGIDESGNLVGTSAGPPYAVSGMPLLSLTNLAARDIRVVGGVDRLNNYGSFVSGKPSPLQANRLSVPDPFKSLPVPTTSSDPTNVNATNRGHVTVVGLPIVGPKRRLYPGVYESISVVSGIAEFHPGVYIIRGKNPATGISFSAVAGQIKAEGVMFYITDSSGYSATSGAPDSGDGETEPAVPSLTTIVPSVVISTALTGSTFSGLSDPASPFNGMLIYQRRQDRRPMVVVGEQLLTANTFSGTIYSKWGQLMFAAVGKYDLRMVVGTMRFINILSTTISPTNLLPAANDVYLVE